MHESVKNIVAWAASKTRQINRSNCAIDFDRCWSATCFECFEIQTFKEELKVIECCFATPFHRVCCSLKGILNVVCYIVLYCVAFICGNVITVECFGQCSVTIWKHHERAVVLWNCAAIHASDKAGL